MLANTENLPLVMDVATQCKAYFKNVLVRRKPQELMTQGHGGSAIALPDRFEKHLWVQVVNVGNGFTDDDTGYRIASTRAQRGDWCICRQFEGHQFRKWLASDGWEYSLVDGRTLECRVKHEFANQEEEKAKESS